MPREGVSRLEGLGFNVLTLPAFDSLPKAIQSHPDSLLFLLKNRLFSYSPYAECGLEVFSDIREYHRNTVLSFVSEDAGKSYPEDTRLNALLMGDKLFSRLESISDAVKEHATALGIKLINTKQGYPACTTLKINSSAAVSADTGMKRLLEKEGIEVLLISSGGISLPPYEYGFIGGASFVFGSKVYFFGDITSHPDGERIIKFIENKGLEAVSLFGGGLIDLGGAVILE